MNYALRLYFPATHRSSINPLLYQYRLHVNLKSTQWGSAGDGLYILPYDWLRFTLGSSTVN